MILKLDFAHHKSSFLLFLAGFFAAGFFGAGFLGAGFLAATFPFPFFFGGSSYYS